jgi:subtilisin-like proprotein convertase family protein
LTQAALVDGVTNGRGGKGIVYVWAAGNGRAQGDNVNYDGYANSRYAMAVGASTALGKVAPYSEDGAPLRVVSPSSDGDASGLRDITTVDMSGDAGYVTGDYSSAFGGTSASAPAVSGVVALLLQANPQLTWRDVQAILMTTAAKIDPSHGDWKTTAAGYHVNHTYGFGRVNAAAAVAAARTWRTLGPETTVELSATPGAMIPDASSTGVTSSIVVGQEQQRLSLEYVEVVIDAPHAYWHDLEITLVAPSGTESILSVPATPTDVTGGANLEGWRFGSARHFGESSLGTWRLRVRDLQRGDVGRLDSWTLRLYGAVASPDAKPPVTSVVPARHWWNGTVKVELRAVDRGSNVARTDLRVAPKANGPFKALAKYELRVAKRTHASDGRRTLWFRSIDNLGNTERVRRFVLNVDTRPPTTAMLGSVVVRRGRVAVLHARARDPGFSAHRVRLRLQVVGANGRVVRLLDAGIRRTGDAVKVRFRCDLPKGRYTVRALARDLAGNAQNVVGSSTLTVI